MYYIRVGPRGEELCHTGNLVAHLGQIGSTDKTGPASTNDNGVVCVVNDRIHLGELVLSLPLFRCLVGNDLPIERGARKGASLDTARRAGGGRRTRCLVERTGCRGDGAAEESR